jgi:hypothetical protein
MDLFTLIGMGDELVKIAALTPEEAAKYERARNRHADMDRKAGAGQISSDETAKMRHNVERLKHYREKKKDDTHKIPTWAVESHGVPPAEAPRPAGGGVGGRRYQDVWEAAYNKARGQGPRPQGGVSSDYLRDAQERLRKARMRIAQEDKKFNAARSGILGGGIGGSVGAGVLDSYLDTRAKKKGKKRSVASRVLVNVGLPTVGAVGGGLLGYHLVRH